MKIVKASKRQVRLGVSNRRGERGEATSVTATNAKQEFGRVLETVIRGPKEILN